MRDGPDRWLCRECGHVCTNADLLRAPHPFHSPFTPRFCSKQIVGCPKCREVETMTRACDVEGCGLAASSFIPLRGCRCYEHRDTEIPHA